MLIVNALRFIILSVVLCADKLIIILSFPTIPPHAAFIAFAFLFSSYVAIISTGCGNTSGATPKFFFMFISPFLKILTVSFYNIKYFSIPNQNEAMTAY